SPAAPFRPLVAPPTATPAGPLVDGLATWLLASMLGITFTDAPFPGPSLTRGDSAASGLAGPPAPMMSPGWFCPPGCGSPWLGMPNPKPEPPGPPSWPGGPLKTTPAGRLRGRGLSSAAGAPANPLGATWVGNAGLIVAFGPGVPPPGKRPFPDPASAEPVP